MDRHQEKSTSKSQDMFRNIGPADDAERNGVVANDKLSNTPPSWLPARLRSSGGVGAATKYSRINDDEYDRSDGLRTPRIG